MSRSTLLLGVSVSTQRVRTHPFDTKTFPFGTRKRLLARSAFALAAINRAFAGVLPNVPRLLLFRFA